MKLKFTVGVLLLGILVVYLMTQLRVVSDMGQFMPTARHDPQLQALMSELQNGPAATALMLRIYAASSSTLADLSLQLSDKLKKDNHIFRDVHNGAEAMDWRVAESLFPYRYLLSEKQDWNAPGLNMHFEQRLNELRSGAGALLGDMLGADPQLVFVKYLRGIIELSGPDKEQGVWFDSGKQSALLLVQIRANKLELDLMQEAADQIRKVFVDISTGSDAKLEIAGPGIMAVETRAAIEEVMQFMTYFIVILLFFVFIIAYRSFYSLVFAGVPLVSAIIVAMVVTQSLFGEVHSIVLVFGITLLGVCLDYPLHLFSHMRAGQSPRVSLEKIWPTLKFGGLSSVFAFLALLGSGFEGLSQLAIFAASGLATALAVTRYLLPRLQFMSHIRPRLWSISVALGLKARVFLVVLLLILPSLIIAKSDFFWESSIHALSPVPVKAREKDQALRHELNLPEVSHVFLLSGTDVNSVLLASEKIEKKLKVLKDIGIIKRIWSPSQILPSHETQYQRQLSLPSSAVLRENVEAVLTKTPFRLSSFEAWFESVDSSRLLKPIGYNEISTTPLGSVLRQGLFKSDHEWIGVVRVGGVSSIAEFHAWLESQPEVKKYYIEVKQATEHLLSEYRETTFERLIVVVMVLALVVSSLSRSIRVTGLIILPIGIGILSGIAMPILMGVAINVFHLLAILLVIGLGLDYSLFFNRAGSGKIAQQQCFHAISISAFTTTIAFLVLAFSSVPVLAGIGQTVSAGVLVCFLSSWILSGTREIENEGGVLL